MRFARRVGAAAGVDADQLAPVGRNDEVVFGELESRHHIDDSRHRFADAARREGMAVHRVGGERRREDGRLVGSLVSAERLVALRLARIAARAVHCRELKVDLAQPAGVGRPVGMLNAPGEVGERGVALAEQARQLCANDTRHPAREVHLAAGEPLGFVEHDDTVAHPAYALEQQHVVGATRAQRRDGDQVLRFLHVAQLRVEALAQVFEIRDAFGVAPGVGELRHQQEQQLRVRWRMPLVHLLQVGELRAFADGG